MIQQTAIEGLLQIKRPTHHDDRGFFREPFRLEELQTALGREVKFVQQNHARSSHNVLRGLHAERWEKLVYVTNGRVLTAIADVRRGSRTFGKVETFELGEPDWLSLFLPAGVAHGYYVLSNTADYVYLVTEYYDGSDNRAVAWNDAELAIPWPTADPILSRRDRENPPLSELMRMELS